VLSGVVQTPKFKNLQTQCLSFANDQNTPAVGCVPIKLTSQCLPTFENYLSKWREDGLTSWPRDGHGRLLIIGNLDENITVFPAWIEHVDVSEASSKWGRIGKNATLETGQLPNNSRVNNVTLAIPHRDVPGTARDRRNGLLQPSVNHSNRLLKHR
jgi:hypothetical protein